MEYLKKGFLFSLIMIVICGFLYPIILTGIGQVFFPYEANGSILVKDGKEVGSELIGQVYSGEKYFMGRVSGINYNMDEEAKALSGSQNLGISSEELKARAEKDIENFLKKNPTVEKSEITNELITESGSALDPHITVRGAMIQVDRISKVTGISKEALEKIIIDNTEKKFLGMYGEERVNVLNLNLKIDEMLE